MPDKSFVRMSELFSFEAAKSHGAEDYDPGPFPFVTSTMQNNGVVSYVMPMLGDKIFNGPALSISGLGVATVQLERFLPKGNGGDSLTVCTPSTSMTSYQLIAVAAAFNSLHAWRFSYGRKCGPARIAPLMLPRALPEVTPIWSSEAEADQLIAEKLRDLTS